MNDTIKEKLIVIIIGTLKGMGGAERQAILLAENLLKRDYKVKLISFSGGETENLLKKKKIPYAIYPFNGYQPFKKNIYPLLKLTLKLRKLKPFALIPYITLNSKYIGLIWKFTGAKFACWNQRDEGREVFGSRLEKISANNVPVIVSNSIPGKEVIIKKIGISNNKIKIINNGIELPGLEDKSFGWRQKLDLPKHSVLVSMLASIYKYKDHKTLIKAWALVQNEFQESKIKPVLILAGTFKGMEQELKVLCFDLRIAETVYFIGATAHTNALIRDSRLMVHSSNKEGCPNAVLEAMALAKPVVATEISGNLQALSTKYKNYCINKENNHKDLASKIIYLLKNEVLGQEIGAYNRKRIETEFSISKMVDAYTSLILEHSRD